MEIKEKITKVLNDNLEKYGLDKEDICITFKANKKANIKIILNKDKDKRYDLYDTFNVSVQYHTDNNSYKIYIDKYEGCLGYYTCEQWLQIHNFVGLIEGVL